MKKILRCVRKLKWGLAVCGGGLIVANIIGLFVPLRNPAIYTEADTEVTTPSAKADGFYAHARTSVPRWGRKPQSEAQDILGGIDITVDDQPAGA